MNDQKYYRLENIINIPNLYNSLSDCTRGLMWKESVVRASEFSDILINSIMSDFYYNKNYVFDKLFHTYVNERGTQRLICSTTIRDRIVQKAFNQNFLLPAFKNTFIYDNTASLKGKGINFAINRLKYFMHNAYIEYGGNNFYVLKLDIRKYFDNIYHPYILNKISEHTDDQRVLNYFINMMYNFQYDEYIHNGENIPSGVGLGGEVPQSFGLICLNEFDHIAKEKYKFKYYVRYMDDIIILFNDKLYLENFLLFADNYIKTILNMNFNYHKTSITNISEGILFLKIHFYIDNNGGIYKQVYKKTIKRTKQKMRSLKDLLDNNIVTFSDINRFYNSIRGSISRCNCYDEINALDELFNTLYINDWLEGISQ